MDILVLLSGLLGLFAFAGLSCAKSYFEKGRLRGMEEAVREMEGRARVIVIEGAGDHFCAGADLRYVAETNERREFIEQINRAFFAIERAEIPVVAVVQGYALAGGFDHQMARRLDLHLREDREREAENVKTGPEV